MPKKTSEPTNTTLGETKVATKVCRYLEVDKERKDNAVEKDNSPCVHSGTTTSRTVTNDTGPIHANAASATIDLTAAPPWMTQEMLQQFMAHLKALPQLRTNPMTVGNKRGAEGTGGTDITTSLKKQKHQKSKSKRVKKMKLENKTEIATTSEGTDDSNSGLRHTLHI
jgi:hypothetical protein